MSLESPIQEMRKQKPALKDEKKSEKSQAELRAALEKKLLTTKPAIDASVAEYEKALSNNAFEDAQGEARGSGEKRQVEMQKKLLGMVERAEKMKKQLDSGVELPQTPEADTASLGAGNKAFLKQTFEGWYNATDAARAIDKVEAMDPTLQDYETLAGDTNPAEFGAYTLNPEAQGIDFEHARTFVPDLSAFNGKLLHEVAKHVMDTYGDQYYVPGIEYWKWLCEHPNEVPQNLKDGNYYFCYGSVLRGKGGIWDVPYGRWRGSEWRRSADRLTREWYSSYRVVLLEK